MKYHTLLTANKGLNTPSTNPCKLLGGRASFENVGGRPNVFNGKPHSVYIPARSKFTIKAESAAEIALPSAPGYTTYYLWFLAGNQRVQATVDDLQLGWVSKTVGMLKELGH